MGPSRSLVSVRRQPRTLILLHPNGYCSTALTIRPQFRFGLRGLSLGIWPSLDKLGAPRLRLLGMHAVVEFDGVCIPQEIAPNAERGKPLALEIEFNAGCDLGRRRAHRRECLRALLLQPQLVGRL